MNSLSTKSKLSTQSVQASRPKINDDFQSYITEQMVKTTFNGLEVSTFSWYKDVLNK